MKMVRAIEMTQDTAFANGPVLVDVSAGEQFLVMHLAGHPRANEVTAHAAAQLIADNRARILDEVPQDIEHYSLLNGKYVEPESEPKEGNSDKEPAPEEDATPTGPAPEGV